MSAALPMVARYKLRLGGRRVRRGCRLRGRPVTPVPSRCAGSGAFGVGAVGEVSVVGGPQALVEAHLRHPAENVAGVGAVDGAAGLAVVFRGVPAQLALEADQPGNGLDGL